MGLVDNLDGTLHTSLSVDTFPDFAKGAFSQDVSNLVLLSQVCDISQTLEQFKVEHFLHLSLEHGRALVLNSCGGSWIVTTRASSTEGL